MSPFKQHVADWKDCRLCALCDGRARVCLARGTLPADILFVGEAPGESENVLGQPFVGPAGQLLDMIVQRAMPVGALLPTVAFTNLVACFPKEQKRSGDNEPPDFAIKACIPRLAELVALANPKLVVCVGLLAAKWLHKFRADYGLGDTPLVDIVHPAAILRAVDAKKQSMRRNAEVVLATALQKLVKEER